MLKDAKWCSRSKDVDRGHKREQQRWRKNNWEDAPSRLPSKPRTVSRGYYASPSSAPLWRYLEASVGKLWSEVVQRIPKDQASNLDWTMKRDVVEQDGHFFSVSGWDGYFFVKDNILYKLPEKRWLKRQHKRVRMEGLVKNGNLYEVWYREIKKGVVLKQENLITFRKGMRTVIHEADVLEFGGMIYARRNGLWYKRDLVGMREIFTGHWSGGFHRAVADEGVKWIREKVRDEPIYKEFQVDGKKQKELQRLSELSEVPTAVVRV